MSGERKTQVLRLEPPQELIFKGPFSDVITTHLILGNPSEKTVLFKVKTTAPKQYCVRPNSGVLEPSKEQTIAVMLQPSMDLSSVDKSKHKFMVQSMYAPPDFDSDSLDLLWRSVAKTDLMDSKLKCSFVEDQDQEQGAADTTQSETPSTLTQTAQDGAGVEEVEQAETEDLMMSVTGEAMVLPSSPLTSKQQEEPAKPAMEASADVMHSTAGSTPAHVSKSERETAEIEAKLRAMQDKIDKLSRENTQLKGETSTLRQRIKPTPAATSTTKFPPSPTPTPSSPLNVIAILLILVALVLGYLVGRWL